jgi:gliding motility-associated protein GldM
MVKIKTDIIMKKMVGTMLFLVTISFIVNAQGTSQDAVVAATNMNILYLGIVNPVEIAVPGVLPDKVTVTLSNGTIKKVSNGWEAIPANTGEAVFTISVNGKKVADKTFRVKTIPFPVAVFAGKNMGSVSKTEALKVETLEARLPDFVWDINFKIKSFSLLFSSEAADTMEFAKDNRITERMKSLLTHLQRGQTLAFKDIKATGPDGRTVDLNSIILKID